MKTTGNKQIKLLDWEKKWLKAMEGDTNPTVVRIEGRIYTLFINTTIGKQALNQSNKLKN